MQSTTILIAIGVVGSILACASDGATGDPAAPAAQGGSPVTGPVLTDIDTQSEATETCTTLRTKLDSTSHQRMVNGRCAVEGLIASSNGTASCPAVSQSCLSKVAPALGSEGHCAPKDFPACGNVSISEFIDCSAAIVKAGASYYGYFTCESPLSTLQQEMQTPPECEAPFARCAAFAMFW